MAFVRKTFAVEWGELIPLELAPTDALLKFQLRNRQRFAPYSPWRSEEFFTMRHWAAQKRKSSRDRKTELALRWVLLQDEIVLAQINMDQIFRGVFQSAVLGYALDESMEGRGVMTACLREVIHYAFETLNLHRISAHHVPENQRSEAVLARLGFEKEGFAKSYLRLNGAWRDHVLNSFINPKTIR